MIKNNQCSTCLHCLICNKKNIIDKFDDDNKKFIGVDITMDKCRDYEEAK